MVVTKFEIRAERWELWIPVLYRNGTGRSDWASQSAMRGVGASIIGHETSLLRGVHWISAQNKKIGTRLFVHLVRFESVVDDAIEAELPNCVLLSSRQRDWKEQLPVPQFQSFNRLSSKFISFYRLNLIISISISISIVSFISYWFDLIWIDLIWLSLTRHRIG